MKTEIVSAFSMYKRGEREKAQLKIAELREKYSHKINIFELVLDEVKYKKGIAL